MSTFASHRVPWVCFLFGKSSCVCIPKCINKFSSQPLNNDHHFLNCDYEPMRGETEVHSVGRNALGRFGSRDHACQGSISQLIIQKDVLSPCRPALAPLVVLDILMSHSLGWHWARCTNETVRKVRSGAASIYIAPFFSPHLIWLYSPSCSHSPARVSKVVENFLRLLLWHHFTTETVDILTSFSLRDIYNRSLEIEIFCQLSHAHARI